MSDPVSVVGPSLAIQDARVTSGPVISDGQKSNNVNSQVSNATDEGVGVSLEELESAARSLESLVETNTKTALSFSVEQELGRMVVEVSSAESGEIIRQFPPQEFITVAKHIAAMNPEMLDDDYLKGILFDQYT